MTPAAQLQTTIELLEHIHTRGLPADVVLNLFFRQNRFIGSKDRQVIQTWVFGFYRHLSSTLWVGQSIDPTVSVLSDQRTLLLITLIRQRFLSYESTVLFCDGKKYHPQPLNSKEHIMLRKLTSCDRELPLHIACEMPEHWRALFEETFGNQWINLATSLYQQAPVDLRINTLKISVEQAYIQAKHYDAHIEKTPLSPLGLRRWKRSSLHECVLYQSGCLEIQDEGSQLIGYMLHVQPGLNVLDYCAGAGGKTLTIAALMHNKGKMIALDPVASRVKRAQERLRRAGVFNTQCLVLEPSIQRWLERKKGFFDRILLDVPCSGTGTWRRNPDLKWRTTPQDLSELTVKQSQILSNAAPLLKSGGILVYATCSLLACENQDQIQRFLEKNPDFNILKASDILAAQGVPYTSSSCFLTLYPHQHGTDGFFAAALQKN